MPGFEKDQYLSRPTTPSHSLCPWSTSLPSFIILSPCRDQAPLKALRICPGTGRSGQHADQLFVAEMPWAPLCPKSSYTRDGVLRLPLALHEDADPSTSWELEE